MAYDVERERAREIVLEAAEVVLDWHKKGFEVDYKGEDDPVTSADRAANDLILARLKEYFPDDAVLSEESRDDLSRLESKRVWIVDPLDGTKDFVSGTGDFCVMIGLADEGVPVVGAVCKPLDMTVWHAARGQGAVVETRGAEPRALAVSDVTVPSEMCLVVTRTHRFALMEELIQVLGISAEHPLGSVGLKVGALSTAEADIYVHLSPGVKEWDTCGPEAILSEAGGRITDTFGEPLLYNQRDVMRNHGVLASNGRVHEKLADLIRPLAEKAFSK